MAHLYLNLKDGKVIGCQTGPSVDKKTGKKIPARTGDDIVPVSEEIYNDFNRLAPYKEMVYDGKGFTVLPDPRPKIAVAVPSLQKIGERVAMEITRDTKEISKDSEQLVEYEAPDGRVGLIRAEFRDGVARCSFTPDKSGRYRIRGNREYKLNQEAIIAVYEE